MWLVCAILSAVFAAATSILAKVGIEGVGSNLATAIRTMVVVVMAWIMVLITNQQGGISGITPKSWLFLCCFSSCPALPPERRGSSIIGPYR